MGLNDKIFLTGRYLSLCSLLWLVRRATIAPLTTLLLILIKSGQEQCGVLLAEASRLGEEKVPSPSLHRCNNCPAQLVLEWNTV